MNKRKLVTYGLFGVLLLGVYFANVEIQSYLGRKTLNQTGLEIHELEQALSLAGSQDKLVLADLSAIWCPTCRKVDKIVLSDPKVREAINERFIFARIEYESDQGEAFKKKYEVSGFPRILILDPQGKKLRALQVTTDPTEFISQLAH